MPLDKVPNVNPSQFADDSGLWARNKSIWKSAGQLQLALKDVEGWCCKWRVVLSPAKTQMIVFSRTPSHQITVPRIRLFGTRLVKTEEAIFLGLILNPRLTWQPHLDKLIQKAWLRINLMRRIAALQKPHHPEVLLHIYRSFVRPIFDHASVAFCNMANSHWQKIERIQTAAMRIILNLPAYTPYSLLHDACPIGSLKEHLQRGAKRTFEMMLNNSELIQQLYEEHRNSTPREAHKSPMQVLLEL